MKRLGPSEWWNGVLLHLANASVAHAVSAEELQSGNTVAYQTFRQILRDELTEAKRIADRHPKRPREWAHVAEEMTSVISDLQRLSSEIERGAGDAALFEKELARLDERLADVWRAATHLSRQVGVGLISPADMAQAVRNSITEVA